MPDENKNIVIKDELKGNLPLTYNKFGLNLVYTTEDELFKIYDAIIYVVNRHDELFIKSIYTHPINKEPLKTVYEDIDKLITEFQEDCAGDSMELANLLACDIQNIFERMFPHVPQLNFFPKDMKDIDIIKQQQATIDKLTFTLRDIKAIDEVATQAGYLATEALKEE